MSSIFSVDSQYIVKVADFGMSKDVYVKNYFREEAGSHARPLRWMALESIREGIYNTSTDVVSPC